MRPRPPALARHLLEWAAGRLDTPELPEDAADLFVERADRLGPHAARWWYRRQAWATLVRALRPLEPTAPRDPRGPRRSAGISMLDLKLACRMLARYPGLSAVSVFGMAVAIAVGAGYYAGIEAMLDPPIPLPEGDRLVSLVRSDARSPENPDRRSLHDVEVWRDELRSVGDLTAFRTVRRNLIGAGTGVALVEVAEMSPAGFRAARVPPALGRVLVEEDRREGAPEVLVVGWQEWQDHFAADPDVIGRAVRLGSRTHTIVGVMPEGFRVPISHGYWVPLRLDASAYPRGEGPEVHVFGRLADGASLESAQAELETLGHRMATDFPDSHRHIRPFVLRYAQPFVGVDTPAMERLIRKIQFAFGLLLVLIAANVAVLVYARTATRLAEITIRNALGASRSRIVGQLFIEACVLAGLSAVAGLGLTAIALEIAEGFLVADSTAFWLRLELTPGTILFATALTVLAAAIVGVVPGLQATGRRLHAGLQLIGSRGADMYLGRTWTGLIVTQVALAVALLPASLLFSAQIGARGLARPGYAAEHYLRARISLEGRDVPDSAEEEGRAGMPLVRFREDAAELLRRLEDEPSVSGVTFASSFVGFGGYERMEVEAGARGDDPRWVRTLPIAPDLFEVLDVPVVSGRAFTEADALEGSTAAIVDELFVRKHLGGGSPLGRRIRSVRRMPDGDAPEFGPWLEIVGVVPDFALQINSDEPEAQVFRPFSLAMAPATLALEMRVQGRPPAEMAGRVREIAAAIDPDLQVSDLKSADAMHDDIKGALFYTALAIALVTLSVLFLSAAGIYAMMSFTVTRRRKEIGIRTALGAAPGRLLAAVFARASAQLGGGATVGLVLAWLIRGPVDGRGLLMLPAVALLMAGVGLLATLGPARRGLRVEVMEALREE